MKSYAFYDDKMRLSIENEQNIINEMSDALENNEFVPYYQPKYDVKTNKPVGGGSCKVDTPYQGIYLTWCVYPDI